MPPSTAYHTQGALDEALDYWREVLRLKDWEITARIVSADEIGEGITGNCGINEHKLSATIKLLDPAESNDNSSLDHELILIHELLHIHLQPLEPPQFHYRLEIAKEQAVHVIAGGLAKLSRKEKHG